MCEAFGATQDDFRDILRVEDVMYPALVNKWNKKATKGDK